MEKTENKQESGNDINTNFCNFQILDDIGETLQTHIISMIKKGHIDEALKSLENVKGLEREDIIVKCIENGDSNGMVKVLDKLEEREWLEKQDYKNIIKTIIERRDIQCVVKILDKLEEREWLEKQDYKNILQWLFVNKYENEIFKKMKILDDGVFKSIMYDGISEIVSSEKYRCVMQNYRLSTRQLIDSYVNNCDAEVYFHHKHDGVDINNIRKYVLFDKLSYDSNGMAKIIIDTNELHRLNCIELTQDMRVKSYWAVRGNRRGVSHMINLEDCPYEPKTSKLMIVVKRETDDYTFYEVEDNEQIRYKIITAYWCGNSGGTREPGEELKFYQGGSVSNSINYRMNHALIPENEDVTLMNKPYWAKLYDEAISRYKLNLNNGDEIKFIAEDDINFGYSLQELEYIGIWDRERDEDYKYYMFIKRGGKRRLVQADNNYDINKVKMRMLHKLEYDEVLYYDRWFNMIVRIGNELCLISSKGEKSYLGGTKIIDEREKCYLDMENKDEYQEYNIESNRIGKKVFQLIKTDKGMVKEEIPNFGGVWHKFE